MLSNNFMFIMASCSKLLQLWLLALPTMQRLILRPLLSESLFSSPLSHLHSSLPMKKKQKTRGVVSFTKSQRKREGGNEGRKWVGRTCMIFVLKSFMLWDIWMNSDHVYDPTSDPGASKQETGNIR